MKKILSISLSTLLVFSFIYSCSSDEEAPPPNIVQTPASETPTPTQYNLTVSAGEGGSVSSEGGTYDEGTSITLTATPEEGFVFEKWSNGSYDSTISYEVIGNNTLNALFVPNQLNGWYSIFNGDNPNSISNPMYYLNGEGDELKIAHFESNVIKDVGFIRNASDFWNTNSNQKAIYFQDASNDYIAGEFDPVEGRPNFTSPWSYIESINHFQNGLFIATVQRVNNIGSGVDITYQWNPEYWILVKFDYDNYPKMWELNLSQNGFLSDPVYGNKDYTDIRSYIQMFFQDVERYGGVTNFNENDVRVVWTDYGGQGAGGGGSCDEPTLWLDTQYWNINANGKFYDKFNHFLGVVYHELGHAIWGLDHICASGHIMTGWHGARAGKDCRGIKDVNYAGELTTIGHLKFNQSGLGIDSWQRAVKDLVLLNGQYAWGCGSGELNVDDIIDEEIYDINLIIGRYRKLPVTNNWHEVEIYNNNGSVIWSNAAGVSWSLEIRDGKVWAGSDSAYGEQQLRVSLNRDGSVRSLSFNGEEYVKYE